MALKINPRFQSLGDAYLFSQIQREVTAFHKANSATEILPLGIGDVTLPLIRPVAKALIDGTREMQTEKGFHGYAPEGGYPFLREAVASYYRRLGVTVSFSSVFISDGAKSDLSAFPELFDDAPAVLADPVYPVFYESNLLASRSVLCLPATEENRYLPMPDDLPAGRGPDGALVYLCSPNNPTGAAYDRAGLSAWVSYALDTGSVLLYDACYEAYITEELPHSIYEIPGAEYCAAEIGSLSKCAGFTGLRCSWCILPETLRLGSVSLAALWSRRAAMKHNGVAYPVQRAAEAALSCAGIAAWQKQVAYYRENARLLRGTLTRCHIPFSGGVNAPYLWLSLGREKSWDFFRRLLRETGIVGTPGVGFGEAGEGHFRFSSFGSHRTAKKAADRLADFLTKNV